MSEKAQQIESTIAEYVNTAALRDKADVRSFNDRVFSKLGTDPLASLTSFGAILESSLFEIIQEKWASVNEKAPEGKGPRPGLGTYISFIERSVPNINGNVVLTLNLLGKYRNHYAHEESAAHSRDQDTQVAVECAIKILHFLVWKYECWAVDQPQNIPRSVKDLRLLLPWGSEKVIDVSNKFRDTALGVNQLLENQRVDAWGTASIKSRIHAIAELVAQEAADTAGMAVATYPYAAFTLVIPLINDLRWRRGYMAGLKRILDVPKSFKRLGDLSWEDVDPPCPVTTGILKAEQTSTSSVLIFLDDHPALNVINLSESEIKTVCDAVNGYGRLGFPRIPTLTLQQRLGEIEIYASNESQDEMAQALFRNRHALVPLLAHMGMPGSSWLLPNREKPLHASWSHAGELHGRHDPGLLSSDIQNDHTVIEETFTATGAVQIEADEYSSQSEELARLLERFETFNATEENPAEAFRKALESLDLDPGMRDQFMAVFNQWTLLGLSPESIINLLSILRSPSS